MLADDYTAAVQRHLSRFDRHLGIQVLEATPARVRLQLTIAPEHTQIHEVVHGGVYCSLVETAASIGAALSARAFGRTIVGVENQTSFLRAAGSGVLHVLAEPLSAGRRTQVWSVRITNDEEQLVATGQLRVLCIEPGTLPGGSGGRPSSPFRV
jgi:uncharacterized protein (TIGR00369 family)